MISLGGSKDFQVPTKFTTRQVSLIMLLVTLLVPSGIFISGFRYSPDGLDIRFAVMAATWIFLIGIGTEETVYGFAGPGFHLVNRSGFFYLLFLNSFSFLFALAVVLRCSGRISRKKALIAGALTMFFPLTNVLPDLISLSSVFQIGIDPLFYAGPIPIQLAIGLYIMKTRSPPELSSPWDDQNSTNTK